MIVMKMYFNNYNVNKKIIIYFFILGIIDRQMQYTDIICFGIILHF